MKRPDIDIISDCLKGNQLAYKHLYERYISYCYGICIRYSVAQSEMKDVVQVIFAQAFQSLKNYDSDKSQFKTWFTRVCINNILSYRKKQLNVFQIQHFEDFNNGLDNFNEDYINNKIDKEYILTLIKKMPMNFQVVFNMFVIDGYSHQEISKQLSISVASSRVILSRAKKWVKASYINYINS